jgi:hypothetical protein
VLRLVSNNSSPIVSSLRASSCIDTPETYFRYYGYDRAPQLGSVKIALMEPLCWEFRFATF